MDTFDTENQVIGREIEDIEKYGDEATAFIGKIVMSAGEKPVLGRKIVMDVAKPHLVLICGKRGAGKSYGLAVILEELARQKPEIKRRLAVIAIDTVGIFWTLKVPAKNEKEILSEWNLKPEATSCRVLVPKGKESFYREKQIPIDGSFTLKTSELDTEEWLALFKLTFKDAEGVLLSNVLERVREVKGAYYDLDDLVMACEADTKSSELAKNALSGRFSAAKNWGLFEKEGTRIGDLTKPGTVTVIDVSAYRQAIGMESTRDIIVGLIGKKIFEERMLYRKEEEVRVISGLSRESKLPLVWMLIDEAHMFMPNDENNIALNVLLEWIRVGRQPGLGLVLATQRPNKLHPDAISQADVFISYRLTAQPDIEAVSLLRPAYLHADFGRSYAEMPRSKGFALVLDDNSEKMFMCKIRPRFSWDGGTTASAFLE